jgi:hypothetical protein
MAARYRILVFGKAGCEKCKTLHKRLDEMLAREEWSDFEKQPCDVESVEGLIAFCKSECVNPQRIPGFIVLRRRAGEEGFDPVERPVPGRADPACGASALYSLVGLQTDYSGTGRGVLTPKMILATLTEARFSAP